MFLPLWIYWQIFYLRQKKWWLDVTMIRWSIFSLRILLRTRPIKLNGGKLKPYSLSQRCRNSSFAIMPGSGFHAMYRGSWWHSPDVNRSRAGCSMCVAISWKTEISSFHPELPLAFHDSHSPCTFRALERYSADSAICLLKDIFKRICWCPRVLCCVYPLFQKIWKCSLVVYLQGNCYISVASDCPFVNVRVTKFSAINSRT